MKTYHTDCLAGVNFATNGGFQCCEPLNNDDQRISNILQSVLSQIQINFNQTNNIINTKISSLEKNLNNFNDKIEKLEKKYDNSIENLDSRVQTLESTSQVNFNEKDIIDKAAIDMSNRQKKALNLILFGLVESPNVSVEEGKMENILNLLKLNVNTTSFCRVGTPSQNKNRPVAITVTSQTEMYNSLRNAKNLPEGISINFDRTPIQIEKFNNLRKQVLDHNRNNPDEPKTIRHFDGVPRIVNFIKNQEPQETVSLDTNLSVVAPKKNNNLSTRNNASTSYAGLKSQSATNKISRTKNSSTNAFISNSTSLSKPNNTRGRGRCGLRGGLKRSSISLTEISGDCLDSNSAGSSKNLSQQSKKTKMK